MFDAFDLFVKDYDFSKESIKLKYYHSLRVSDICYQLGKKINMRDEDLSLAKLIGLIHDVGRFKQWTETESFKDTKEYDHSEIGIELLFEEGLIRKFVEDTSNDEIIKAAIKYHNDIEIPNNLDTRTHLFSQIIRDADKVDILKIKSEMDTIELNCNAVSDEVYEYFINYKRISFKSMKSKCDGLVLLAALLYDINYVYSIEVIYNNKYIENLFNKVNFEKSEEIKNRAIEYMEKRIKEGQ